MGGSVESEDAKAGEGGGGRHGRTVVVSAEEAGRNLLVGGRGARRLSQYESGGGKG